MLAAEIIFATLFGAVLGSFLNVVAYRLPRGESLVAPGSHCTSCTAAVKPYDNVPVLAWMWLHGRCRACRAAISPRYPVVELGTGALFAGVVATRRLATVAGRGRPGPGGGRQRVGHPGRPAGPGGPARRLGRRALRPAGRHRRLGAGGLTRSPA